MLPTLLIIGRVVLKKFNYYMVEDVEASVKHLLKHSQITFKFISPKGKRILKQMWGVYVPGLWFVPELNKWFDANDIKPEYSMTTHDTTVKTFKAFKRYIKNHPELYGEKVILVSNYVGHDIEVVVK